MQPVNPPTATPETEDSSTITRRDVLKTAAGAGILMMIPALQGCAHADDAAAPVWQSAGKTADFVKGTPTRVALKSGEVLYITRTDDKTLTAVSAKCTHRGCELGWDKDQKDLVCPCHGGVFGSDGKNVQGTMRNPAKNLPALPTVPVRQNAGQVEVNLTGIAVDTLTPQRDA